MPVFVVVFKLEPKNIISKNKKKRNETKRKIINLLIHTYIPLALPR